jgi:hypothetical protein
MHRGVGLFIGVMQQEWSRPDFVAKPSLTMVIDHGTIPYEGSVHL